MEKILYAVMILLLCLGVNGEYEDEQLNPSTDYKGFLEDICYLIDNTTAQNLMELLDSKTLPSKGSIAEITGDIFTAELVYARLKTMKEGLSVEAGGMMSDFETDFKVYERLSYSKAGHGAFLLAEKDIGEEKYYDNIKAGYSYREFIAGSYRIKTGRGLLFDWSDHSMTARPLISNRVETDMSLSEFPAFTGLCWSGPLWKFMVSGFASYNLYDARLVNDTAYTVYTYNNHIDSLSASRQDNMNEMLGGTILRMGNALNLGLYGANYSHVIKDIESSYNGAVSIFGELKPFTYDMAYSLNGGYAVSCAFSKNFKYGNFKGGFTAMKDYYNVHSLNFLNNEKCVEARISLIKPLRLILKNEYDFEKRQLTSCITYKPYSFVTFKLNAKGTDKLQFQAKMVKTAGYFTASCALSMTSANSSITRGDIMFDNERFLIAGFAYAYDINEGDILSQYEAFIPGIYPMHSLREGSGIRTGLRIGISGNEHISAEFAAVTDMDDETDLGLYIHYQQ